MRDSHRLRPEELMNPDLLSEAVLMGGALVVVVAFLLVLLRARG